MATTTSFQKKIRSKYLQIPGTKPSLYNSQLLISTGIPSLDNVIGGGMAVGTVLLIEEDVYGSYARLLVKYFLAESVMTGQALLLSSVDVEPKDFIKELPGPILDDPAEAMKSSSESVQPEDDNMTIAWRYQNMPKFQSTQSNSKFGHYYDLTKIMDPQRLKTCQKTLVSASDLAKPKSPNNNPVMNCEYHQLLKKIKEVIHCGQFSTSCHNEKKKILRIGLHSLGSPLWDRCITSNPPDRAHYDPSLPRFLMALRSLMRSAFAACIITMPTHLFQESSYVHRIHNLCDTVIQLDSFAGSDKEKNPAFKEYHGLFHILKLPRLNSLMSHMPDTLDLAFKLRRKKFTIEKLHLPPDLSETASRSQEDPLSSRLQATGMHSSTTSKLDF